jgi:TonB-dependent receptor
MDLVPAKLLDKVVVRKTFTPDQQGNFSGGSVDIGTKSLPDKLTLTFSQSTGYNERATFNDDFLSFRTSEAFWRASNNGSLDIPRALSDPETEIPDYGAAQKDIESAMLLDYYSTAFNNEMAPITKKAPVNHNYSFSFGNRYSLFEHPVGILASLTYSHKTSFYDDGTVNRWVLSGSSAEELTREYNWNDTRGEEDVLWGGLAELNYQPHANHQVGITFIYNRNANASARYLTGPWPEQVGRYTFETRVLHYVERELNSLQIKGENYIGTGFPLRVEWIGSISSTSKDEPDLRYFSNQYRLVGNPKASPDNPDEPDSIYAYRINKSSYTLPTRYYRYMEEDNKSFKVDFSYPFRQWSSLQGKFGFGALYTRTTREMREQRFVYDQRRPNVYSGDPESFFGPEYTGLTDSVAKGTYTRYVFDNYIKNEYQPSNNYDGEQDMFAFYVMAQLPLTRRLQSVFGVRREKTDMEVINFVDSSGTLNDRDLLPSFSLVYKLTDKMNVRSAYGRTLARPNFREKAPFRAFEFVGDYIFNGNIYLERTLIDNYDLRWEYFADPGEIFAVSAYYKDFHQPIERVIINHNGEVTYRNVDQAVVYGLEFEARTNLSRFWSLLGNLSLGGNFSLIHSSVTISDEEREVLEDYGLLDEERPLQGQSPYLINIDLYYENRSSGTSATLLYNVFGKRLYEVSLGGTPNVYEQPTQILDLTFSQAIIGKLKFGLSVKNLLNSTARMTQEWDGLEYTTYEYRLGRTFSVGTSFSL